MMRILSLFVVLIINTGFAKAEDVKLRPLVEILAEEQSDEIVTYAIQRCAALFAAVVDVTKNSPSASQELIDTSEEASGYLTLVSTVILMQQRSITYEEAKETNLKVIFEISLLYDKEMNEYYFRTGGSINEKILRDIALCTEIHSGFKEEQN